MKEFDYIIIGGGCAGLSLAYELEINNKLINYNICQINNFVLKWLIFKWKKN